MRVRYCTLSVGQQYGAIGGQLLLELWNGGLISVHFSVFAYVTLRYVTGYGDSRRR
jgi:hypothetical protein